MDISFNEYNENINIIKALIENNDIQIAYNLCKKLLKWKFSDDKYIFQILDYQSKCGAIDNKSTCNYNEDIVKTLTTKLKENESAGIKDNSITITTTTCKRLELFIQTVNSFINCCLDISDYVYQWIVIDDNSSEEDRNIMSSKYPFITFIYKTPEQKGHAKSMNMLLDVIKTPYIFNLEDDWRFFVKDKYLSKCLDILNEDTRYGQCLLNRSYVEELEAVSRIGGGFRRYTLKGDRYYIHEYLIVEAMNNCVKTLSGKTHCIYWPHYSLRVGLTRSDVYKKLGKYDENARHFEQDYAYKYYIKGRYLTTYLDSVYCTHIGRRTYERNTDKVNAYDLNGEKQFGEKPKQNITNNIESNSLANNSLASGGLSNPQVQEPIDIDKIPKINSKIYVLNLKRRPDRLKKFKEMNINEISQFHVFEAVDVMSLKPSHKIQKLFQHNDYKYRRGIVGCALSHVAMWHELITKNLDSMVILEDDAELTNNFIEKLLHVISISPNADIIFLGHHPYSKYSNPDDLNRDNIPITEKWSRERCIRESMGGTTGYYITRNGALNMFKRIGQESIVNGIDWVMFKTADINNIYYCSPFIVFAECFQNTGNTDTYIQRVYDGVGYNSVEQWIKDEVDYLLKHFNTGGLNTETDFYDYKNDSTSPIKVVENLPSKIDLIKNINICKSYDKNTYQNVLKFMPVKYYTVDKYLITIPENRINDKLLNDKTFGEYINRINPV